jgi:hypothetical protein
MIGTLHLLQDLLPRHRFELGAVGLDDVDGVAAGAALLKRAVEDGLGTGAPEARLDAVLLLEGLDHRSEIGRLGRGVDGELALLSGTRDQPLQAIAAVVGRQFGDRRRSGCRRRSTARSRQ